MSIHLGWLFRRTSYRTLTSPFSASVARAPKKKDKKGDKGASAAPVSDDVVNIFKDRDDPIILPSEYYPPWIFEHLGKKYSPWEMISQIQYGKRVPRGQEQYTFSKSLKRFQNRNNNDYGKYEEAYSSDEDWKEGEPGDVADFLAKEAHEAAEAAKADDGDSGK